MTTSSATPTGMDSAITLAAASSSGCCGTESTQGGGAVSSPLAQLECNICLGSFCGDSAGALACGHTFCHRCLLKLLEQDDILCPTCRRPMEGIENINLGATIRSLKHLVECGECHSKTVPVEQAKWCPQCCLLLCPQCDAREIGSGSGIMNTGGLTYACLDEHAGHTTTPWSPEQAVRMCYEEWLAEEAQAQAWLEREQAKLGELVEWIESKFIWLIIEEIAKRLYDAYVVKGAGVLGRKLEERYKASTDACRAKMSRWKFMFSRDIMDLSPPMGSTSVPSNYCGNYGERKSTVESEMSGSGGLDCSVSMVEIIQWQDASSSGVSTGCQDNESNDDSFSIKLSEFQRKLKEQILEFGAGGSSNSGSSAFSCHRTVGGVSFGNCESNISTTATISVNKRHNKRYSTNNKSIVGRRQQLFNDDNSITSQDEEDECASLDLDEYVDTRDTPTIPASCRTASSVPSANGSKIEDGLGIPSGADVKLETVITAGDNGDYCKSKIAGVSLDSFIGTPSCSTASTETSNDHSSAELCDRTSAGGFGPSCPSSAGGNFITRISDMKMRVMIRNLLPKDIDDPSGTENGAAGRRHAVDLESALTALPIDLHGYDYRTITELEGRKGKIAELVGKDVVNRWTTPCLDRIMRGDYPNAWDNASRLHEDGQVGLDEDDDERQRLADYEATLSDLSNRYLDNAARNGYSGWFGTNTSGAGFTVFGDRDVISGIGGVIGGNPGGLDPHGLSPDDPHCHNQAHCPSTSKNIFDGRAALDNFTVFQPKDLTVVPTSGDVVMACRNRGLLVFTSELEFKKAVVPSVGEFNLTAKDWRMSFVAANERTLFATREPANTLHSFDPLTFELQPMAWKLPSLYQDFSVIRVNDTELFLLKSSQIYKLDLRELRDLVNLSGAGSGVSGTESPKFGESEPQRPGVPDDNPKLGTPSLGQPLNDRYCQSSTAGESSTVTISMEVDRHPMEIPESMLTLLFHPDTEASTTQRPFYLRDICVTLDSVFVSASPYPDDEADVAGSDVYNRILQVSPLDGSIVREFSSFPDYPDAYDALVLAVDLPNGLLFYNDSYGVRAVDLASGQRVGTTDDHAMLDGRLAAVDGHLYNVPHKYANGCEILLTGVDYDTKASDARGMLEYEPDNKPSTGGAAGTGNAERGARGPGSGTEDTSWTSERIWE